MQKIPWYAYIIGVVIILALAYVVVGASSPTVQTGDAVLVNYTGYFANGTVFGTSAGSAPLNFTVGAGQVIPGFDQAVVGMKVGQEKNITLQPSEGYGAINPALIVTVPRSKFGNQSITVGMVVSEIANGQQAQGLVTKINATNVTVNFNSPLAGKTLIFKITVVGIHAKS